MFSSIPITTHASIAHETFARVYAKARRQAFLNQLLHQPTTLKTFGQGVNRNQETGIYRGVQDVEIDKIIGSVSRSNDFDRHFRPLKRSMAHRWAAMLLYFANSTPEPIQVYKLGDAYYILDGHHRVSVARFYGQLILRADVWEFKTTETQPQVG